MNLRSCLLLLLACWGSALASPLPGEPPESVVKAALDRANARARAGDDPSLIEAELLRTLEAARLSPEVANAQPEPWDVYGSQERRTVYETPSPARSGADTDEPEGTYAFGNKDLGEAGQGTGYSVGPNTGGRRSGQSEFSDPRTGSRLRVEVPPEGSDL